MRDDTKHATEVEQASRKLVRATFEMDAGTHLSEKEVVKDAFSNNEANTQDIERVKVGSNKICIREDLAKEKMVFSRETSRAIFEIGNVELIESKKSSIHAHDAYTTFLKEHFSANAVCWKSRSRLDEPD